MDTAYNTYILYGVFNCTGKYLVFAYVVLFLIIFICANKVNPNYTKNSY